VFKAGKVLMWLALASAAAMPAYWVIDHLFDRGEPAVKVAPAPPAKPLPTRPKDLKIPENGEFDPYAKRLWTCKKGFVQVDESCQRH
jgi:hypothetical protein